MAGASHTRVAGLTSLASASRTSSAITTASSSASASAISSTGALVCPVANSSTLITIIGKIIPLSLLSLGLALSLALTLCILPSILS